MIGLIIALIVISSVAGRRRDRRKSDFFKISVAGMILIAAVAALLAPYLFPIAFIFLIIYLVNRQNEKKRNSDYTEDSWSEKAQSAGYRKKKTTPIDEFLDGLFGAFDYKPSETNKNPYSKDNKTYGYAENPTDKQKLERELEILSKNGGAAGQNAGGTQRDVYANYNRGNAQAANNRGYSTNADQYRNTSQGDAAFNKGDMRLPSSPKKRRKIVAAFNEKYDLYLTDEQIDNIVNASYFSAAWHKEVVDMNKKYVTVHQWINGPLGWLRTYIYAFHVQDITSDLYQQERIVIYAFDQIFAYLDALGPMSMANRIRLANQKFFTDFDDITFMHAYNFLNSKGIHYELKTDDISKSFDPVDDLVEKYAVNPSEQAQ